MSTIREVKIVAGEILQIQNLWHSQKKRNKYHGAYPHTSETQREKGVGVHLQRLRFAVVSLYYDHPFSVLLWSHSLQHHHSCFSCLQI